MNNLHASEKRRNFLKQSLAIAFSVSTLPSIAGVSKWSGPKQGSAIDPLPLELVHEFVQAAHVNLPKVKELLGMEPNLVNACWDWGGGDFEVALGGAAHMGNRDIANYLLDNNARIDIFCGAMLGEKGLVEALIKSKPAIANVTGPHKFPLLYHIAISGDIGMAELVKPHIIKDRLAKDCNRSLQAAARSGHTIMVEWLLANGVDNPDAKDILGRTPLKIAEENGHNEVMLLLKKRGAH
ncbi:MAG: ankyrin repeat domain-containing protein [Chitinophagaceae bacterium]